MDNYFDEMKVAMIRTNISEDRGANLILGF
jgi:hypothetical protein